MDGLAADSSASFRLRLPVSVAIALATLCLGSACSHDVSNATAPSQTPTPTQSPGLPTAATAADLSFCVQESNRVRGQVGRPPLTESGALEVFAADGAKVDSDANTAHRHFTTTVGPAFAENEVLRWPLVLFRTVQTTIQQAIATFVSEGPSGGHYQNLMGGATQLGCGVFITSDLITVVQDFR